MARRIRLRQDVTIRSVAHERRGLKVHVRTPAGARHWIRFLVDDPIVLFDHLATLRQWMAHGTQLTYLSAGGAGTLLDDRALFESAFNGMPDS
jgi:hypothetical protein